MQTSKWWARVRKRFTLIAISVLLAGLGLNMILAFAPNVVSPRWSLIAVFGGIGIMIIGIIIFGIALGRALSEESLVTPEVYQKIGGVCHLWKWDWMAFHPELFKEGISSGRKYVDVWDWMGKQKHPYTIENWIKYKPLFDQPINRVNDELIQILRLFPNSIDEPFKIEVLNAIQQLTAQRVGYMDIPNFEQQIISQIAGTNDTIKWLDGSFEGVIFYLANLSRKADKIYNSRKVS